MATHGKKGRKHGRQSRNQTQARYWASKRLAIRKIRNVAMHTGLSMDEARRLWESARCWRRMKKVY